MLLLVYIDLNGVWYHFGRLLFGNGLYRVTRDHHLNEQPTITAQSMHLYHCSSCTINAQSATTISNTHSTV